MNIRKKEKKTARIKGIIEDSFRLIGSTPSRTEAMKLIAELAIKEFGDYITPGALHTTDDAHIIFIELLDQIIYELRENNECNSNIKDYIIDNLYSRLSLILEAINSREMYIKNIRNRNLFNDDLVIIKNMELSELVPLLVNESEDITHLQLQIVKTLLSFTENLPLDYYYSTFKAATSGYIKAASLLGLKYSCSKGLNWHAVKEVRNGMTGLITYAENFNLDSHSSNKFPGTREELTLALLHAELTAGSISGIADAEWILNSMNSCSGYSFDNIWFAEINITMGNILLRINTDMLNKLLRDEKRLIQTARMIDRLPKNIFNRITGRLDELDTEFIFDLNSVIEKKKVPVNDYNSNIMSYLCFKANDSF